MPEATMLLGAALGIFLVIAIILISIFHRRSPRRRTAGDVGGPHAGTGAVGTSKADPDGGWWSGGDDGGGGDGGGGD